MVRRITSSHNPYVLWVKSLQNRRTRHSERKFLVEGIKLIWEAIQSDTNIHSIIMEESIFILNEDLQSEIQRRGIPVYFVTRSILQSVCDTESPQGIAAVIHFLDNKEQQLDIVHGHKLVIALDCIQDPGNLGTIIRTADAAAAACVILSEGSVDAYNPKVIRSTMGSMFHIPIIQSNDLLESINSLKEKGYTIITSSLQGTNFFDRPKIDTGIVLIIGNESKGVRKSLSDQADHLYKLPMLGKAESLNASVAAGIMIYDLMRDKLFKV